MEDINNENTDTTNESSAVEQPETIAYKELYEEQVEIVKQLREENSTLKVANAKLAIQQPVGTPKVSTEELLSKMF